MAKEEQESKSPEEQIQELINLANEALGKNNNSSGEGQSESNPSSSTLKPDPSAGTNPASAPGSNPEPSTSTDPESSTNPGSDSDTNPSPVPNTGSEQSTPPKNPFLDSTNQQPVQSVGELLKDLDNVSVDTAFANDSFNVIGSLKFEDLIGNPLRAAMKAQRDMARESLDFVKKDVMKTTQDGQGKLTYVTLNFRQDGKEVTMQIPLITLVPYPSLMISQMTFNFTAKIDALSSLVVGVGKDVKADWGPSASWSSNNKPAASGAAPGVTATQGTNKPQSTDMTQATQKTQSTDQTQTTSTANSASEAAAKMAGVKTNSNASLGASYASGVSKGSRYNVQTTMDVSITANSQEPPKGLTHIIDILDQSTEVINTKGELIISADQAILTGNIAAINATYRNPIGSYEPVKVECEPYGEGDKKPKYPQMLPNGDYVMLLFSEKGTYLVKAGNYTRVVIIN